MFMNSINEMDVVTIFGGSGFVGRYVVEIVARTGAKIRIIHHHAAHESEIALCGQVGQITFFKLPTTKDGMMQLMRHTTHVINLIGILSETHKNTFQKVNVSIARMIAECASQLKIKRFVHVSALVPQNLQSRYAKSKLEGEMAVLQSFPGAVIIRPGIIVGVESHFIQMILKVMKKQSRRKFKGKKIYIN
jgi:NADH dehydrogenase